MKSVLPCSSPVCLLTYLLFVNDGSADRRRPYLLATFLQLLPSVLFCFKGMRGFQSSAPLNHVSRLDVSRKTKKKHTVWTIKCDTFSTSCSSFLGSKELVKVCLKSKYNTIRSFCHSRVHVPLATNFEHCKMIHNIYKKSNTIHGPYCTVAAIAKIAKLPLSESRQMIKTNKNLS